MKRHAWGKLNSRQLGKYAEYFVKMELTMHGLDIYTPEIDDKGIDFVVKRGPANFWDVQVKSVYKSNYVFFTKSKFNIDQPKLEHSAQ